jgi:hypothetical protein
MSALKYEIDFESRFRLGGRKTIVVDLCDLSDAEIRDAMRGPGGLYGPVAWGYAFRWATKQMGAEFVGLMETIRAVRVQ